MKKILSFSSIFTIVSVKTCIKRSPLCRSKSDHLRQETFEMRFIHDNLFKQWELKKVHFEIKWLSNSLTINCQLLRNSWKDSIVNKGIWSFSSQMVCVLDENLPVKNTWIVWVCIMLPIPKWVHSTCNACLSCNRSAMYFSLCFLLQA